MKSASTANRHLSLPGRGSVLSRFLERVRETRREKEILRMKSHLAWEPLQVEDIRPKKRRRG